VHIISQCIRGGLNLIASVGVRLVGSVFGPSCGKDLGGLSFGIAGDVVYPSGIPGGLGGSINIGGGLSGGYSVGPDVGVGVSFGLEFCAVKVTACYKSPPQCKNCPQKQ
jgi:hypothetical protein